MGQRGICNGFPWDMGTLVVLVAASDLALRENEIASIIQELEVVHTVACHMLLGKSWRSRTWMKLVLTWWLIDMK